MKKMIAVLIAMLLLLIAFTVAYAANTSDQLENAGYTCVNAGPYNLTHCFPPYISFPDDLLSGKPKTVQVKVFDVYGTTFLGTELLVRHDLYNGQSCPQDGLDEYEDISEATGFPYYACHHFSR